jgi:hypothetical protein
MYLSFLKLIILVLNHAHFLDIAMSFRPVCLEDRESAYKSILHAALVFSTDPPVLVSVYPSSVRI